MNLVDKITESVKNAFIIYINRKFYRLDLNNWQFNTNYDIVYAKINNF